MLQDEKLNTGKLKDIATFEHYKLSWDEIIFKLIKLGETDCFSIQQYFDGYGYEWEVFLDALAYYGYVDFVYPMHLNPNVRKPISEVFGAEPPSNMFFIEPLDYLPFVFLMEKSTIVLTDSGGIQEEAPGLGKPVLVMRDTTERPEALKAGTVKLVGTDFDKIVSEVSLLLDDPVHYNAMSQAVNPYGDGMACPRILEALRS